MGCQGENSQEILFSWVSGDKKQKGVRGGERIQVAPTSIRILSARHTGIDLHKGEEERKKPPG